MKQFSLRAPRKEPVDLGFEIPRTDNPVEPTEFLTCKLCDNTVPFTNETERLLFCSLPDTAGNKISKRPKLLLK